MSDIKFPKGYRQAGAEFSTLELSVGNKTLRMIPVEHHVENDWTFVGWRTLNAKDGKVYVSDLAKLGPELTEDYRNRVVTFRGEETLFESYIPEPRRGDKRLNPIHKAEFEAEYTDGNGRKLNIVAKVRLAGPDDRTSDILSATIVLQGQRAGRSAKPEAESDDDF